MRQYKPVTRKKPFDLQKSKAKVQAKLSKEFALCPPEYRREFLRRLHGIVDEMRQDIERRKGIQSKSE